MRLNPFGERVLVKRGTEEKIGSLYIPEEAKKSSLKGIVIEKGPDCVWVAIGDEILFGRYSGFELPIEGFKDHLIMNETDIIAGIIKEDA